MEYTPFTVVLPPLWVEHTIPHCSPAPLYVRSVNSNFGISSSFDNFLLEPSQSTLIPNYPCLLLPACGAMGGVRIIVSWFFHVQRIPAHIWTEECVLFAYELSCGNEIGSDVANYKDDIIQLCKHSLMWLYCVWCGTKG